MSNEYSKLGKNIKGLRKAFGESQLDLANCIGLDYPSAISNYEKGERVPERDILIKIAKHYRITEDELINGNYENMIKIADMQINEKVKKESISKFFIITYSDKALENENFTKAYEIHKKLLNCLINEVEMDIDEIEKFLELYDKAANEGIIEAVANTASWIIFFGVLLFFTTPELEENIERFKNREYTAKEFIDCAYLHSFIEPELEDCDKYQEDIKEYSKEISHDLKKSIAILKNSKKYEKLGDYFLALSYTFNLINNGLSGEMNSAIGLELLSCFSSMGNTYAKNFLK